jgi:hypothetical protein
MKAALVALMIMFSATTYAAPYYLSPPNIPTAPTNKMRDRVTKNMLEQVYKINYSWLPVIGKSLYIIHKNTTSVLVIKMYDSKKMDDVDPEVADVQVVFVETNGEYKLAAVCFSSVDLTKYIDMLVQ